MAAVAEPAVGTLPGVAGSAEAAAAAVPAPVLAEQKDSSAAAVARLLQTPGNPEDPKCYTFCGSVDCDTLEKATIICKALEVDQELHPEKVSRSLSTDGSQLIIKFAATELRLLRAAVGTFYDLLALSIRTTEEFPMVDR